MPEEAKKILVITAGTSLVSSATWRADSSFNTIDGYAEWCADGSPFLTEPRTRAERPTPSGAQPRSIRDAIENLLRANARNPAPLAAQVENPDVGPPARFSAELTTILRLNQQEGKGASLENFLRNTYSHVVLVSSADANDLAALAAIHQQAILGRWSKLDVDLMQQLPSAGIFEQTTKLCELLLDFSDERWIDVIISGGYKAYAATLGRLLPLRLRWTLLYVHEEEGSKLVELTNESLRVDGSERAFRDLAGITII